MIGTRHPRRAMHHGAIHSRFDLIRPLGEGGMGVVYEAFDRVREERVALKTIRFVEGDAIYRLKREFRALANVEHPNLVRLYDLFVGDDGCFFTMELVEGVDFVRHCRPPRPDSGLAGDSTLDEARLRAALVGLVRGVGAVHEAGLLHRDLKPSNVLVTDGGRVVILDFGLTADAYAGIPQSQLGRIVGSIAYMAPEQARGETELTFAIDWYAVGAILFEALVGRPPFVGHAYAMLTSKQTGDAPPAGAFDPETPVDLEALASELLSRDPSARPGFDGILAALGDPSRSARSNRSSVPPLLARDHELAALGRAFARARAGASVVVSIRGGSGVGKTALVTAFARERAGEGALVLASRCYERETVPFKGLDGIVDALCPSLAKIDFGALPPSAQAELGDLATLFPVTRRIQAIGAAYARRPVDGATSARARAKGFACLRAMVRQLAREKPVVLAIDDVHWADEDTALGLAELLRGDEPIPMLLLLAARTIDGRVAPAHERIEAALRSELAVPLERVSLEVDPLPASAIEEIVRRELAGGHSESMIGAIARESRGFPFAAGEIVRFLRDGATRSDLGASIDDAIRRRADGLPEGARALLDVIAVSGEPIDAVAALRAAGLPDEDRSPIDLLRVKHFVRALRAGPGTALDVAHDRIREAVAHALGDEARAKVHLALALALESSEAPAPDRLARHFAAAGAREMARHHALAGARAATASLAFLRAADLFELALASSDGEARASLLPAVGDALAQAGRYPRAAEVYLEAAKRAPRASALDLRRRAGESMLRAGRLAVGLELLRDLASELGIKVPEDRGAAMRELAFAQTRLFFRGTGYRLREPSEVSPRHLERLDLVNTLAGTIALCDPLRGASAMTRCLLAGLDVGEPSRLAMGLAYQATWSSLLGRYERSRGYLSVLDGLVARAADPRVLVWWEFGHGAAATFAARFRDGAGHLRRAVDGLERCPRSLPWELSMVRYFLGVACVGTLELDVLHALEDHVREQAANGDLFAEVSAGSSVLGYLHVIEGRIPALERAFEETIARPADHPLKWASGYARMMHAWGVLYAGDARGALEGMVSAYRAFEEHGTTRIPITRGEGLRVWAAAALAARDLAAAERPMRLLAQEKSPQGKIHAAITRGTHAAIAGRRDEAIVELRGALAASMRLGWARMELAASYGLAQLLEGAEAAPYRRVVDEIAERAAIRDVERYALTYVPI